MLFKNSNVVHQSRNRVPLHVKIMKTKEMQNGSDVNPPPGLLDDGDRGGQLDRAVLEDLQAAQLRAADNILANEAEHQTSEESNT